MLPRSPSLLLRVAYVFPIRKLPFITLAALYLLVTTVNYKEM